MWSAGMATWKEGKQGFSSVKHSYMIIIENYNKNRKNATFEENLYSHITLNQCNHLWKSWKFSFTWSRGMLTIGSWMTLSNNLAFPMIPPAAWNSANLVFKISSVRSVILSDCSAGHFWISEYVALHNRQQWRTEQRVDPTLWFHWHKSTWNQLISPRHPIPILE